MFGERRQSLWIFNAFGEVIRPAVMTAVATLPRMASHGVEGFAKSFGGRRTFILRPEVLLATERTRVKDAATAAAYRKLIMRADRALSAGPYSVTHKTTTPPSGDKHDYMSLASYWWPDPEKPDGLPYIRRDGRLNPERKGDGFDSFRMQTFARDASKLALAYYHTNDLRYANHLATWLRTWFLEPATRMNPNLNFTQSAPGSTSARHNGVIDTIYLMPLVEAIGLILPSGALSDADVRGLEAWFSSYVDWLISDHLALEESISKNNHGLWYDAQLSLFALFARRIDVARTVIDKFPSARIEPQFSPDGTFPAELTRTQTLHYFVYSLCASYDVAGIGECLGVDLWNYRTEAGAGLRTATDFLARYGGSNITDWPYPDEGSEPNKLTDLLLRAHVQWPEANYLRALGSSVSAASY